MFRASSVRCTESSAVRFVHVPGWSWACQIGRDSQFVGWPAAAGQNSAAELRAASCVAWPPLLVTVSSTAQFSPAARQRTSDHSRISRQFAHGNFSGTTQVGMTGGTFGKGGTVPFCHQSSARMCSSVVALTLAEVAAVTSSTLNSRCFSVGSPMHTGEPTS